MTIQPDSLAATLRRLSNEARGLESYQTNFVTQHDITRISTDMSRLLAVLAITDPTRLEEPEDLIELRERLNIVRADLAALLVSVQNLHEKAEGMNGTLNNLENIVDSTDEVL